MDPNVGKNKIADRLFAEFLENFPKFESMVRTYYMRGENSIIIYTKAGGKFIFEKTNDGFSLTSE